MHASVDSVEVQPILKIIEVGDRHDIAVLIDPDPHKLLDSHFRMHQQNHIREHVHSHGHVQPEGPLVVCYVLPR